MKSKIPILLTYLIGSLLNTYCTQQNSLGNIGNMKTISILKPDNGSNVNISTFVKEVKIIPLEFNKHCILGKIEKIEITKEEIYIKDEQNITGILKFNIKGKFIGIIGKQGKGPGEHIELTDFSLNKNTNSLYIFDNAQKKIAEYSLDSKFIKDIPIGFGSSNFMYKDNLFYFYLMGRKLHESYDLIIMDKQNKILSKYFKSKPEERSSWHKVFLDQPNGLLASFAYNDTIYTLKKDKLEYAYYIDFEKHKVRENDHKVLLDWNTNIDQLLIKNKYISGIKNLSRVKNIMYFTYAYMNLLYSALYNIKTDHVITSNSFSDDISYLYFSSPISQTEESLIGVYDPSSIESNIKFIKDCLKKNTFPNTNKLQSTVSWLDSYKNQGIANLNPFIIIYVIK